MSVPSDQATARHSSFLIGGTWTAAEGPDVVTVSCSTTGEALGAFPDATEADIDHAVAAARRALADPSGWSIWSPDERALAMERLAAAVERRGEAMAQLIAREVGTPIEVARGSSAQYAARLLRFYAGVARGLDGESSRPALAGHTLVRREPVGVVALIVPWNYPVSLACFKLAPALASGSTAVLKPSPETGLSSYLLAEAVDEAGLPPGVVNIVPAGREVGAYLVAHPGVDKVSFTGSTDAGRSVAQQCGSLLRPVTLELGGKSAAVVLDDVALDVFADALLGSSFPNNGQTCTASTRILAPRSIFADVCNAVTEKARSYRLGDPRDTTTDIGPLVSARQRDRVEGYIRVGRDEGGRVTAGGGRPDGLDPGLFVEPTVFIDVDPGMTIVAEEIFGPVVVLLPYDGGDDDAVQLANDSTYGLAGTVWSADTGRAIDVARRIDTGIVGINGWDLDIGSPFGGRRQSGLGHELGPEGIDGYLRYKTLFVA
ncbi:aldehyde dehydrogenase [Actinophytocola sp.]|uniref:aldehyde dehydrogenase n=1 Tax=Actinophytocola sp. TaxID=1872138 RepID=UPI003899F377